MIFKDGKPSTFYQTYVREIQKIIEENAAMEFACIWAEHAKHGGTKARTLISDELSSTLNNLQAKLEGSDLFDDAATRQPVMKRAIPKTLIDQVGLETLLKRIPEAHQRALFSSWIAAHFVSPRFLSVFVFRRMTEWYSARSTSMAYLPVQLTFSISRGISPRGRNCLDAVLRAICAWCVSSLG